MENWQKDYIVRNLSSLTKLTTCNAELLTKLRSDDVISGFEVEAINAKTTNFEKAEYLYKILLTRTNGYCKLIKALIDSSQSGAADILLKIPLSRTKDLQVVINGKAHKLEDLLDSDGIQAFHTSLQENLVTKDFIQLDEIFTIKNTVQLLRNTIPKPDPLYIPRFLSRRVVINPDLFRNECPDIFVFKEAKLHQIRKFVTNYNIESSSNQLLKKMLTVRFILLDVAADWKKLCAQANTPIHMIRYEKQTEAFLLEATNGGLGFLHNFLENTDLQKCKYISEEEFVQSTYMESVHGVCICDSPGMGKSLLLANLARKISEISPNSIVAFIQLRDLSLAEKPSLDTSTTILEHISASTLAKSILGELVKSKKVRFYLFFDGLDEVQESSQEMTIEFLQKVGDTLPNCKIYVSSRLSLRSRIEEALGVISYDLKPFDEETQCSFLTTFWCQNNNVCDADKLNDFAQLCLHKIKKQLSDAENRITGVPLLCRLIAEVYSEKACLYADKHCKASFNIQDNFANSLTEIYTSFVTRQLGHTQCNFACMFGVISRPVHCDTACQIKSFHVWFAILTIFPKLASNMGIIVCDFKNLSNEQILKPGLFLFHKRTDNACRYAFLHRTFAEFIVAEFFATAIFSKNAPKWNSFCDMETYLKQLVFNEFCDTNFTNPVHIACISFRENVVAYFFNDLLNMDPNFKEFACKVKFDVPKLPTAPSDALASIPAYKPSSRLNYFCVMEACLICNYEAILEILMQGTKNSSIGFLEFLSNNLRQDQGFSSIVDMLYLAVRYCSVHVVQRLCDFYLEVFNFDLIKACSNLFSYQQPIRGAIERADYEMVVWCIDKIPNIPSDILYYCFGFFNYFDDENLIQKKLEIAKLLIRRQKNLLTEFPPGGNPLHQNFLHVKSIKFLITHKIDFRDNQNNIQPTIIHSAASYMCENDFLELVRLIFIDCSCMDLFEKYAVWNDTFLRLEQVSDKCKVKIYISVLQIINNTENVTSVNENNMVEVLKDIVNPTFYSKYHKAFAALFYLALIAGVVDVVDFLISFDKSFLEFDYNKSPLLVAVANKQLDVVKFLMAKGANVFALGAENETILHVALQTRDCEWFYQIVKLLNIHWNYSDTDNGRQTLHITSTNDISTVKTIPQNVHHMFNWEMNGYNTPLRCAIYELRLTPYFLDFFLTCGNAFPMEQDVSILVDLNFASPTNATIIQLAIERNQSLDFVKALVNHGADWAVKDKNGCNLVHLCTKYYLSEYIQYFLDKGLDVNELDSRENNALQSFFFDYSHVICKRVQTFPEIFNILVKARLNIENKNVWGQTVLHIAAMRGSSIPDDIFDFLKHNTNSDRCHKVDGCHSV